MSLPYNVLRELLDAEEPDYKKLGPRLSDDEVPHLSRMVLGDNPLLAAKATYAAGLIGTRASLEVVRKAASSSSASLRVAAASSTKFLPTEIAQDVLLQLVDDVDLGVRKAALRSSTQHRSEVLQQRIEAQSKNRRCGVTRELSKEVLRMQGIKPHSLPSGGSMASAQVSMNQEATTKKAKSTKRTKQ